MTKRIPPGSAPAREPKPMGRPRRAAEEKEDQRVPVMMTKADRQKLQALADAAGVGASGWFKAQLRRARLPAAGSAS